MSEIKEKYIENTLAPISIKTTEIILDQMKNCICKIHIEGNKGTGFFIKFKYNNKLLRLLITSNHILNRKELKPGNDINISLNNEKILKTIKIDSKRKKYTNEKLDITIIEIKDEDKIQNFLLLDDNMINNTINNYNEQYKNESIYILNYLNGKEIFTSLGILNNIEDNKIFHKCNTDISSSGSPIILLKNNKVIGVHNSYDKNNNFNFGMLIKKPLLEYIKLNEVNKNKNTKIVRKKIILENKIENKININNYIIAEINIKEEDIGKKIRIINSFEEYKRNHGIYDIEEKDYYLYENEKEIKSNCKIKINNKNINFNYFHSFKEKGKYIIEYIFTNNLTKADLIFAECELITNINLSSFNTQNITNMNGMFGLCKSLTNINLSNVNTQKVIYMSGMFLGCEALTYINLSSFNTQKVTDMRSMFLGCSSLININLSNFNTQNVTDMFSMFFGCEKLKYLNLSNFNTKKVTNMMNMFSGCKSLTNLNLVNFSTKNVTDMRNMFLGCELLKKENIITKDKKLLNDF